MINNYFDELIKFMMMIKSKYPAGFWFGIFIIVLILIQTLVSIIFYIYRTYVFEPKFKNSFIENSIDLGEFINNKKIVSIITSYPYIKEGINEFKKWYVRISNNNGTITEKSFDLYRVNIIYSNTYAIDIKTSFNQDIYPPKVNIYMPDPNQYRYTKRQLRQMKKEKSQINIESAYSSTQSNLYSSAYSSKME